MKSTALRSWLLLHLNKQVLKKTIYSRTTHIKSKPTAAATGECVSSETDNAHGYNPQDKHKERITNKILGIL